jgi:hypothetical protein
VRVRAAIWIGLAGGCLASLGALSSMALEGKPISLRVLWSTNILGAPPPESVGTIITYRRATGLVLRAQSMFADGRIVWLGDVIGPRSDSRVLLMDAERAGPDDAVTLKLHGVASTQRPGVFGDVLAGKPPDPTPFVSNIAVGPSGKIWVAGSSNGYTDIASTFHSDAYLAAVDQSGTPVWEKTYSNGGRRNIRNLAQMASGELIVAGSDGRESWVARVGADATSCGRATWATTWIVRSPPCLTIGSLLWDSKIRDPPKQKTIKAT